jgi:hypothetical protein
MCSTVNRQSDRQAPGFVIARVWKRKGDRRTGTTKVPESQPRPDLIWDHETRGLCLRVYGDGSKSFIFVYRVRDRQRFLRIGKTPVWSLEGARDWAKELGAIVDQGGDPESHNRERAKFGPVENVIRYIREELKTNATRNG